MDEWIAIFWIGRDFVCIGRSYISSWDSFVCQVMVVLSGSSNGVWPSAMKQDPLNLCVFIGRGLNILDFDRLDSCLALWILLPVVGKQFYKNIIVL